MIRLALAVGSAALIFVLLPRADRQSYSYELNQPWKYQLLTADFDLPVMRDSASARRMRDSIDAHFVPFVKRSDQVAQQYTERFSKLAHGRVAVAQQKALGRLLEHVYDRGILDSRTYMFVQSSADKRLRTSALSDGASMVTPIDASQMLSPARAFAYIDSAYNEERGERLPALDDEVIKALNISLSPNILIDSMADSKFRNQEYLVVNGALGVIKQGQRIVDRGEIVTPQIFTNLNTYMALQERARTSDTHTYYYLGQILYIALCLTGLYLFLHSFRPRFFGNIRKMVFLMSFVTAFVAFAILMFEYIHHGIYLVPFAMVPVVILIFFDSRTAIFSLMVTVMLAALVATFQFQFIFLETTAGLVAALSMHQLTRRSQLLRTAALTFMGYTAAYFIYTLITYGKLTDFSWGIVGMFAINSVVLSFAYILILVVEKGFGFTSTVTLVELSDINNPLLRRLAEEAPGTFQHSMQVSTLASEAARAIGANTQLVRTGALYHDIGKMESPVFFTENQHGVNPHEGLDPETSARKIISHVTDGLATAAKVKLPAVIRDFISEHHGRGLTRYFYNTAVNNSPGGTVDEEKFRYPGPNPRSRETGIMMMADAVEAASRSLKDYSPAAIDALVNKIIDSQIADGLLKDSPLSFKDVETIKQTFKSRLATIYHSRIAYPELHRKASE